MAKLKISYSTDRQRDLILKAEKMLQKAGVSFDSGVDLLNRTVEWELDESLNGAMLEVPIMVLKLKKEVKK